MSKKVQRLPPDVNRILFVKNLPHNVTSEEMYDIFGKFGAIRQIRLGNTSKTKGTSFVVYEDIFAAKAALEQLKGFNICGKYLVILYHNPEKMQRKLDLQKKQEEVENLRKLQAEQEKKLQQYQQ